MSEKNTEYNQRGFTIVELVVVIAVIAILAAVLIPTFSKVVHMAHLSNDKSTVTNMNKHLRVEKELETETLDFYRVVDILDEAGYKVPISPSTENHMFYWIPSDNSVVLFDNENSSVVFPKDFSLQTKAPEWKALSEEASEEVDSEPEDTPDDVPAEDPADEGNYMLLSGKGFNSAVKNACSGVEHIVFGRKSDYLNKETSDVSLSSDGSVQGFVDGKTVYVLANGTIIFNNNSSGMFDGMDSLTDVSFVNVDTSAVTSMKDMFRGCEKLNELDLSGFNTSSVTNTEEMFGGCEAIKKITVSTGTNSWNMSKVLNSKFMFDECYKLRNYDTKKSKWFLTQILSLFDSSFTNDVQYAHTGTNGYLTEK